MPQPTLEQRLTLRRPPVDRVVMEQTWHQLLFLHWRVPADTLQARLPHELTVDTFDGAAWLGIVPFYMRNIRIRGLPGIPTTTNFLELNVRTYVHSADGTPGVWFFSLDANSWLTVQGARRWFGLPYYHCRATAQKDSLQQTVEFQFHRRRSTTALPSHFRFPQATATREAIPGTLEFFLVERYLLFSHDRRKGLHRAQVWHPPYQIAEVVPEVWDAHPLVLAGFETAQRAPDHVLTSPGVTVDVFGPRPLSQN